MTHQPMRSNESAERKEPARDSDLGDRHLRRKFPGFGESGLSVGQALRLDSQGSSSETGEAKPPPKEPAEAAAIEEGPTLPLWARIAIGLDRSFEQARADLLKKAGVGETAAERPQPARPEIRNKADMAPATPQPGEPARPTKTSFHAVIDAAIEELAAVRDLWWKALPGESEPGDGDVAIATAPPRLVPPIAAAALASAAAIAGNWHVNRNRRNRKDGVQSNEMGLQLVHENLALRA